jgi:flagellar protein FlaI
MGTPGREEAEYRTESTVFEGLSGQRRLRNRLEEGTDNGANLHHTVGTRWAKIVQAVEAGFETGDRTGNVLYERYKRYWRNRFASGQEDARALKSIVDERTVDVREDINEDAFFSTVEGHTTLTNRYDLEKAIPPGKKRQFTEEERYWVNKPYAFVVIFHSRRDNETKYYVIEPYMTTIEEDLEEFLAEKLRTAIKYQSEEVLVTEGADRAAVIERETRRLLERYGIYETPSPSSDGLLSRLRGIGSGSDGSSADSNDETSLTDRIGSGDGAIIDATQIDTGQLGGWLGWGDDALEDDADKETPGELPLDGIAARPEPALIAEDDDSLSEYQVEKLLHRLKRDFVGYERIDAIKHDINIEDISCDGYHAPVFVYHTDYEQLITNIHHGDDELDEFVVKLAQRSGKGISKRRPQVDATLPDGSRAQLTLGREVSDHGTNYTIRQFKDVPFTPVDLVNWRTFALDQMAFLWLAIENERNLIFAGGTASGKTTSLNAVSLFIPANMKIVSIEDTREVELPQRNWIASVTRPSFSEDDKGDIDEFELLEASLRQRPDYIVMGEVRGEEGRDLFQVMSTGHTTYTTFHADSVDEVIKRFTTDPINVSKTLFTALDLVSIQTETRVQGKKVRRSKSITEINGYAPENDEINVQDIYQWRAETDEVDEVGRSNVIESIMFDRGWNRDELDREMEKRRIVLAYLIRNGLNDYAEVAATIQSFIADPETILALIATDELEDSLASLREMESVKIDIDPETEALVPRPDPSENVYELAGEILQQADDGILAEYGNTDASAGELKQALTGVGFDTTDDTEEMTGSS